MERLKGKEQNVGIEDRIFQGLKGNARACIIVEPLWIVPHSLFATYASVYMVALGCTDRQIGLIASISLIFQMFFALISGYITDKLGRRRACLIFDIISWSIPTLIWGIAQNFYYFLMAATVNSLVRVAHTSWSCLFIEDTPPKERVHAFTWIQIAGMLAGFIAPFGGILVNKYGLVPAVRGMYIFAFISMTTMFLLRDRLVQETKQGLKRMDETKDENFIDSMKDYLVVAKQLFSSPFILIAFFLSLFTNVNTIIRTNFFGIVLTEKLGFNQQSLSLFPAIQSAGMLLVFIFVMPTLRKLSFKMPLMGGFLAMMLSNLLLVLSPHNNFIIVIVSTLLTAYGTAVCYPFVESILANAIDDEQRAKMMAILYVVLYGITAPFGYIGGYLSSISEELPFLLMTIVFAICLLLVGILDKLDTASQ